MITSNTTRWHRLTPKELAIIDQQQTEAPHSGHLNSETSAGVYACRRCDAPLYLSSQKFSCGCGWPSFDESLPKRVAEFPDPDGRRTEIACGRCRGHLGHVFRGEGLTSKDERHCVNSLALTFIPAFTPEGLERAIVAGGCFWGIEAAFRALPGVRTAVSGFIGGQVVDPTYREVCSGSTGHAEAVEITFDPDLLSFTDLLKEFFEIHDPTQRNRQGPDVGSQYRSGVFYLTEQQRDTSKGLIEQLRSNGLKNVETEITAATRFYPAGPENQNYYEKMGHSCCSSRVIRPWD